MSDDGEAAASSSSSDVAGDTVRVCCRFRPPNAQEMAAGEDADIVISPDEHSLTAKGEGAAKGRDGTFECSFDHIFSNDRDQEYVFMNTAHKMVPDLMRGYNTTIFAYGQTGSGKTHTMMGDPVNPDMMGIIPRLVEDIFEAIADAEEGIEFTVKISYVEIYNEKIRDLLDNNKTNLRIRDSKQGVWIQDVTEVYVGNFDHVLEQMERGQNNRATSSTNMNAESSRSHSVFSLTLGQKRTDTGSTMSAKLFLVDLAGSEKVRKSKAAGQTLMEAKHINKSLSALGNVINACASGKVHIPYRDSKLTRLLSDAIGGNSKTCLIITCSPSTFNLDETVSTLRFGVRAKQITNKAVVNQEKSVAEYKKLLDEAAKHIALQERQIANLKDDVRLLKQACSEAGIKDPTLDKYEKLKRLKAEAKAAKAAAGGGGGDNNDDGDDDDGSSGAHGDGSNGGSNDDDDSCALVELRFDLEQKLKDLQEENQEMQAQVADYESLVKDNEELANLNEEYKVAADQAYAQKAHMASIVQEHDSYRATVKGVQATHKEHVAEMKNRNEELEARVRALELQLSQAELSNSGVGSGDADAQAAAEQESSDLDMKNTLLIGKLHKKCQQFIDLQIEHQATASRLALAEKELKNRQRQDQQLNVLKENIEMKKKLAASEKLCKKLLDSGLYWRQRRRKSARVQRIVIPIQSGGGGGGKITLSGGGGKDASGGGGGGE